MLMVRTRRLGFLAAGVTLSTALAATAGAQTILYVDDDAPAGGDGQSWATAYRFLADAISASGEDAEIRIAAGLYRPDRSAANPAGTLSRMAAFTPTGRMTLRGGYAGIGASNPDMRDPAVHVTMLSGDLAGNDQPDGSGTADNAFNVVRVTETMSEDSLTLDGLLIEGGRADEQFNRYANGAGVWFQASGFGNSSVTILRCTVRGNRSTRAGGGVSIRGAAVVAKDSVFEGNASSDSGGGLYLNTCSLQMDGCQFLGNQGVNGGASGLSANVLAPVRITASLFQGNSGGTAMGLSTFFSNIFVEVRDCSYVDNTGGGLSLSSDGGFSVVGCRFIGNSGTNLGGLAADAESESVIANCDFRGNHSGFNGGGLRLLGSRETLIANCLFSGNSAAGYGGGMIFNSTSHGRVRRIVNCTFYGNSAGEQGGGLVTSDEDDIILNCILWGNSSGMGANTFEQQIDGATPIRYSCVQGLMDAADGNTSADPLVLDAAGPDGQIGTVDDDLTLSPNSPCIDAGLTPELAADAADADWDANAAEAMPIDLHGLPRVQDDPAAPDVGVGAPAIVDIGVYERGTAPLLAIYQGPAGGSWFNPAHWSTGSVPDAGTDVEVHGAVSIDMSGAEGRDVRIAAAGAIEVHAGSLACQSVVCEEGAVLGVREATSLLTTKSVAVRDGGQLAWDAGTVGVTEGGLRVPHPLAVGADADAVLEARGVIDAPYLQIGASGVAEVEGEIRCTVANDGVFSPGAPIGPVVIRGEYMQGSSAELRFDAAGYGAGEEYDMLSVDLRTTLDGAVTLALTGGFVPRVAGRLALMSLGEFAIGSFAQMNIPTLPGTFVFRTEGDLEAWTLLTTLSTTAARLHVDADATGPEDGQSWASAMRSLHSALFLAAEFPGTVHEIWVAEGVYRPQELQEAAGTHATFQLVPGTSVYGGFEGTESAREQRDPTVHVVVLDGDRDGNDDATVRTSFANYDENAGHVVTAGGSPAVAGPWVLDGVTVRGGHARAEEGAGMMVTGADGLTISRCIFRDNRSSHSGAGMEVQASDVTIRDCLFTNNLAFSTGAGLRLKSGNYAPTIIDCEFVGNTMGTAGGFASGTGLSFQADRGAVVGCRFFDNLNLSTSDGGGALLANGVHAVNCIFENNRTWQGRGGALATALTTDGFVANCLFVGNVSGDATSPQHGGAVSVQGGDTVQRFLNCTFAGNTATGLHGGVFARSANSRVFLGNCIFWDNSDSTDVVEGAQLGGLGQITIHSSIVQGWTGLFGGNGNAGGDPVFTNAAAGDFRPGESSAAVDRGDNRLVPLDAPDVDADGNLAERLPMDLSGGPRFTDAVLFPDEGVTDGVNSIVDIGAFEAPADLHNACPCDVDGVPGVDVMDLLTYLNAWFAGSPEAERTGDDPAVVNVFDLLEYLDCWFGAGLGPPCS